MFFHSSCPGILVRLRVFCVNLSVCVCVCVCVCLGVCEREQRIRENVLFGSVSI